MDSLKKVIEIMQYIEDNLEETTEDHLKEKFGDHYILFSRYCLGSAEEYAHNRGAKVDGEGIIFLTQKGIRKLYELRKTRAMERNAQWMKWATVAIAFFAAAQFFVLLFK